METTKCTMCEVHETRDYHRREELARMTAAVTEAAKNIEASSTFALAMRQQRNLALFALAFGALVIFVSAVCK